MNGVKKIAESAVLATVVLWATGLMAGCHGQHPDRRNAVYAALNTHKMDNVEVFQDQDHGVITLKGIVGSADSKTQAAQLAGQAAPGYKVDNQLTVDASGLMSLANPNARPPDMEQLAHPPTESSDPAPPAKTRHHPR